MNRTTLVLGMCVVLTASAAWGQILAEHIGANDPEQEGWSKAAYDNNGQWFIEARPLESDPDFPGTAAWTIEADSGEISYSYELSGEEMADALAQGFTLTGKWRMEWCHENENFNGGNFVGARMPTAWVQVRQGYGGGDTPDTETRAAKILDGGWPDSPIIDLGADGYPTVTMIYDPADGKADYYGNGVLGAANVDFYTAGDTGTFKVMFGGANAGNANDGINNYNLVRLELGMHVPEPQGCNPGDADNDGDVDDDDLSLLLANWGADTDCSHGEFSGVMPVNDDDLSLLLANWTGAVAVPEPATIVLLIGASALLRRRRKA